MVTSAHHKAFIESAEVTIAQELINQVDGQIVARRREVKDELNVRFKAYIDAQVLYATDPEVQRLMQAVRNYDPMAVQELATYREPVTRAKESLDRQMLEYDLLTDSLVMEGVARGFRAGVRHGLRLVTGLMTRFGLTVKECTGSDIRDMFALVIRSPEDDVSVDRLADRLGRLNAVGDSPNE